MRHETNRGYGGALISGFAAATRTWVFYTDGDAQYDASELVRCIDAVQADIDVVQGWKIGRGDPWYRKLIGRAYHHVVRVLFRLRVRDTDCDFRLIRRTLLDRVELTSTTGVICVEMMRKFQAGRCPLRRGRGQPPRPAVRPLAVLPAAGRSPGRCSPSRSCGGTSWCAAGRDRPALQAVESAGARRSRRALPSPR